MILIALGANIPSPAGKPEQTLRAALALMSQHGITVRKVSGFYKTAPVPVSDQPDFINAVAEIETVLQPQALMHTLLKIEKHFGRTRNRRNDPRTLDLDLLDYNGALLNEVEIELPHPRMHERAFVLQPLREIAPNWTHPANKKGLEEFLKPLHAEKIRKL